MKQNYKIEKSVGSGTDPELITALSRDLNIPPQEARTIIDLFVKNVYKLLEINSIVNIRKLGRLYIAKRRKARFRNFKNVMIEIPIMYSVKFKPSSSLRSMVNKALVINRGKILHGT